MPLIYFPNVPVASFQEICKDSMILDKTVDEKQFYSSSGIFTLRNDQIYKYIYKPKQIETIQKEDIVLYKDKSEISYTSHKPLSLSHHHADSAREIQQWTQENF